MQPKQTITARVIAAVTQFEGYTAGYYAAQAGVTRKQFASVARRRLAKYVSPSLCETYYLPGSARLPQN